MLGTVFTLVVALLAPASTGRIVVDVSPSNATIYVDGKRVKPAKGGVLTVSIGSHTVKASAKGYETEQQTISIKRGGTAKVTMRLSSSGGAKTPVAKAPTKRPTAKAPTKRPTTKTPSKRPSKRPVAKRPTSKRPVGKRPSKRPSKSPTVGRRPTKRPTARPGPSVAPTGGAQPAPIRDDRPASAPSYRGYAVVAILVGVAATGGGIYMGSQANASADEFNQSVRRSQKQSLKDDVETQALAANILYGVGAAGLLVGGLLWAAEPDYRASIAPTPDGGAYVGIEGRF